MHIEQIFVIEKNTTTKPLTKTNKSMKVALKYTYSLFQYIVLLLTYTGTLLIVYSMLDMVYGILFN